MDDEHEADHGEASGGEAPGGAKAIDLEKLVEKVRELMREDLRLEQARGASAGAGRRW
jgi:hypothetical protein